MTTDDPGAQQPISQECRFLLAAVGETSEAVLITDEHWEAPEPAIVFVNPAFCAMTGFSREELLGKSPALLDGPKSERVPLIRVEEDLKLANIGIYQRVCYRKTGEPFTVEWQVKALRDPSGVITNFLIFQRDVTERNHLREQIQQAQKMEAIGRLAGGIAHDFNNLLTIIVGYSGLLATELAQNGAAASKQLRSLNEIQLASEKAAALTGQLLTFSRKQVLRTRAVDLNRVVFNLGGMLRRLIGEDVDLELSLSDKECVVRADAGQLEQVLMNLAVNARDAMPWGGMLTIQTRITEVTAHYATATRLESGRYAVLSISDTGIGMDEETRSHIFEPFYTTKDAGRGTGLGLSMVYGFVAQHGGGIEVSSEPGMGACFNVYLPCSESAADADTQVAAVGSRRASGVVLVVEDEDSIRDLVREILESVGYEVLTAANAQQAIALVGTHPGPLDLLLTDVVLPGVSGIDLAAQLKALRPGMRVLFASGYSDHALLRQGNLARGAAFIQKPFATEALLSSIRDMIDGQSAFQAH